MFPFNPRILTVVLFVLSVACISRWVGVSVQRAKRQESAVKALWRLGGSVMYDYECDESWYPVDNAKPPYPRWLGRMLGNDFFQHVVGARVGSDTGLVYVTQAFPSLRVIELGLQDGDRVTDAGFANIGRLIQLNILGFWDAEVTDAGLQHLRALKGLRQLVLQHMPITDAGLAYLKGMTQLKELVVASTQVTNQGVKKLQQELPNCNIRWFPPTQPSRQ